MSATGRDEAHYTDVVRLTPRSGVVGELESCWWSSVDNPAQPVLLDLRHCAYFEVPGMLFVIARVRERILLGLDTTLRLPERAAVLQTLCDYGFETAITRASNTPFVSLVDRDSLEKWHQLTAKQPTDELLPANYYPFQTVFATDPEFGPQLAADSADKWRATYVLTVLNRLLRGYGSALATHVVHEVLMNGVRHANARLLQTGCQTRSYRSSRHLALTMWDDGVSIISTLRRIEGVAEHLLPRRSPHLQRSIRFHVHDEPTVSDGEDSRFDDTISNQDPIAVSSDDPFLLLATVFPGVTSDLTASSGHAHEAVVKEDSDYALPGMGLFVLSDTVTSKLGGSVTVRTSNLRMTVRQGANTDLDIKVSILPEIAGRILGNQITVRIPIVNRSS